MTKMLRRSDAIGFVKKMLAETWSERHRLTDEGRRQEAHQLGRRIPAIREIRDGLTLLPTFEVESYQSADTIPPGIEWAERIALAVQEAEINTPLDQPIMRNAMRALMTRLHLPIDEIRVHVAEMVGAVMADPEIEEAA